jgi:hypothetical protein
VCVFDKRMNSAIRPLAFAALPAVLLIFSKLFYFSKKERGGRISEALRYMGPFNRANDLVKHYSAA